MIKKFIPEDAPNVVDVKAVDLLTLHQECISAAHRQDQLDAEKFNKALQCYALAVLQFVEEKGGIYDAFRRVLYGHHYSLIARMNPPELLIQPRIEFAPKVH